MLLVGCGSSVDIWTAADEGNIKAVKQHLNAGTNVNAKDVKRGSASLHYAAGKGHKETIELLITNGADVNAKEDSGHMPLDIAEEEKDTETADLLRKHGGKHGIIHGAAAGGDIEAVKRFLANGTDVNAKDANGETPLDWAIQFTQTDTADLLRKHGGKTGAELN